MNGYGRFEPMDPNEVTQSAVGTFFLCFYLFTVVSPSHWKAIQRNQLSNEPLTQNQTSSSFTQKGSMPIHNKKTTTKCKIKFT